MEKHHCDYSFDGLFGYYWGDKCLIHDKDYWYKKISRKEADIKLREGIKEKLPKYLHWIAWLYYFGVRVGGRFFW